MEQSDAIAFNLLTEEGAQVLVISDQIDTATKKLLKVLSGFNVFIFTTNLFFPFAKIGKKSVSLQIFLHFFACVDFDVRNPTLSFVRIVRKLV